MGLEEEPGSHSILTGSLKTWVLPLGKSLPFFGSLYL